MNTMLLLLICFDHVLWDKDLLKESDPQRDFLAPVSSEECLDDV